MTDYETPRKLILTKPRSSETAEMGMTRERCFDTPSVLKSILDYVACTGWHRCSTAYIIEHSESNPDNIVFVKTVVHYIEGNYMNPMTSEDIARYVYLSKEYTIRTFKRLTGYSPHAYLKKYRLMKACDYLSDTSLSIKDIAGRVGYRSESNFIAEFKGEKGITPSRFRKSKSNFNDKQ